MNVPAGGINTQGYYCLSVLGKNYRAARLIWLIKTGRWPKHQVDHRNTDNTSGYKGVSWHSQHRKWYVTIQQYGKPKFIGLFAKKGEAISAYKVAAKKHFGDFARV